MRETRKEWRCWQEEKLHGEDDDDNDDDDHPASRKHTRSSFLGIYWVSCHRVVSLSLSLSPEEEQRLMKCSKKCSKKSTWEGETKNKLSLYLSQPLERGCTFVIFNGPERLTRREYTHRILTSSWICSSLAGVLCLSRLPFLSFFLSICSLLCPTNSYSLLRLESTSFLSMERLLLSSKNKKRWREVKRMQERMLFLHSNRTEQNRYLRTPVPKRRRCREIKGGNTRKKNKNT